MKTISLSDLVPLWTDAWPRALQPWSRFTRLKDPVWCLTNEDEKREGLSGSFAMIRLTDHQVVISLRQIAQLGLEDFPAEIMAHEVGHHVYCPADMLDEGRMLARIRKALLTREIKAGMISNLYSDLMINNRLQRSSDFRMARVYKKLGGESADRLWTLYMRIYENLWSLPRNTLVSSQPDRALDADAQLGARLARVYANEWLDGAGSFAMLCLPYLLEDESKHTQRITQALGCDAHANGGEPPSGLVEIDSDEAQVPVHPVDDPRVNGQVSTDGQAPRQPNDRSAKGGSSGQCREPFEYGELLRALGIRMDDHEIAVRYYRERALPHLIRFPTRETPKGSEPLPEATESWDAGMSPQTLDIFESVLRSPTVIPGVTTVQRTYSEIEGSERSRQPVDLDLYVDCSGSMPNPQRLTSYMALAGAIVALSALRAGARVQCTLWSGAGQFLSTPGFTRDETKILEVLTGYLGGGTAFPIHRLRETYLNQQKPDRAVHILVLSDDGVDTMLQKDEQGESGQSVAAQALEVAGGGGTLALNMALGRTATPQFKILSEIGWHIFTIQDEADLVRFARVFSRDLYAEKEKTI